MKNPSTPSIWNWWKYKNLDSTNDEKTLNTLSSGIQEYVKMFGRKENKDIYIDFTSDLTNSKLSVLEEGVDVFEWRDLVWLEFREKDPFVNKKIIQYKRKAAKKEGVHAWINPYLN